MEPSTIMAKTILQNDVYSIKFINHRMRKVQHS